MSKYSVISESFSELLVSLGEQVPARRPASQATVPLKKGKGYSSNTTHINIPVKTPAAKPGIFRKMRSSIAQGLKKRFHKAVMAGATHTADLVHGLVHGNANAKGFNKSKTKYRRAARSLAGGTVKAASRAPRAAVKSVKKAAKGASALGRSAAIAAKPHVQAGIQKVKSMTQAAQAKIKDTGAKLHQKFGDTHNKLQQKFGDAHTKLHQKFGDFTNKTQQKIKDLHTKTQQSIKSLGQQIKQKASTGADQAGLQFQHMKKMSQHLAHHLGQNLSKHWQKAEKTRKTNHANTLKSLFRPSKKPTAGQKAFVSNMQQKKAVGKAAGIMQKTYPPQIHGNNHPHAKPNMPPPEAFGKPNYKRRKGAA